MAALESAVVVYLRALYYPDGFTVALKLIDQKILLIEIVREAATLCMIWAVGYLAGKNIYTRFAFSLICFAVWDIFYYVWLKVFIDWPASLFDWDILFLIPITWLGPVLSPVICSFTMILLAMVIFDLSPTFKVPKTVKALLLSGVALILYTYLYDYGHLIVSHDLLYDYPQLLKNESFVNLASNYLPTHYQWNIFWIGEALIGAAIFQLYKMSTIKNPRSVVPENAMKGKSA